jgi:hypothetical protein
MLSLIGGVKVRIIEASKTVTCADGIRYGGHCRLAAGGRAIIASRSSTGGSETHLLGGR